MLYKQHYTDVDKSILAIDQTYNLKIVFDNKTETDDQWISSSYKVYNNNQEITLPLTFTLTSTRAVEDDFTKMTNGEFWYKYHTAIQWPTVFEYAAMIEAELSTYWTTAYNASKYCQYFLPEFWQDRANAQTNYFAQDIWNVLSVTVDNVTTNHVTLNHKYLPEIRIYETADHQTLLPKYQYHYLYEAANDDSLNDRLINDKTLQSAQTVDTLLYNPALQQYINSISFVSDLKVLASI